MPTRISALPASDTDPLRWHPLARLAARLDQQADDADKAAVDAGLVVTVVSRWRRSYRDPRFLDRDDA